jgi:hypothetical protein
LAVADAQVDVLELEVDAEVGGEDDGPSAGGSHDPVGL